MKIDWFTVVAQALNFLILLWLMKRFLYKPILHAIDEREKLIAAELTGAEEKTMEALARKAEFERKKEELDGLRETFIAESKEEAQRERSRLLEEARQEVADFNSKRKEAFLNEERALHRSVVQRTQDAVFAITRKILKELAGTSLEERMVEIFNRRLRDLDEEEISALRSGLTESAGDVTVRTAFELQSTHQASTRASIKDIFGPEAQVAFKTAPDLIGGIELSVKGQKIAWSIAEHLALIEKDVGDLFDEPVLSAPAGTETGSR